MNISPKKRNHFRIGTTKSTASHSGSLADLSRLRQRITPNQRNGSATASSVKCSPGEFAGYSSSQGTGCLKYSRTDQSRSKPAFRITRSTLYLSANNIAAQITNGPREIVPSRRDMSEIFSFIARLLSVLPTHTPPEYI